MLKIKFLFSCILALFINSSAAVIMLPIMARLSAVLKLQCGSTSKFLLLLERESKGIKILPFRNVIYFAVILLIYDGFSY